jgi:hypothetical protein
VPIEVLTKNTILAPKLVMMLRPEQSFAIKWVNNWKAMTYTIAIVDEGLLI